MVLMLFCSLQVFFFLIRSPVKKTTADFFLLSKSNRKVNSLSIFGKPTHQLCVEILAHFQLSFTTSTNIMSIHFS